jgi:hypothetical protein
VSNEAYSNAYVKLIESGKPINCAAALTEQEHYGPQAIKFVELQVNNDEKSKNFYKALIDANKPELAVQFQEFAATHPGAALDALQGETSELIAYIKENSKHLDNRQELIDLCSRAQDNLTEKSINVLESWQQLTSVKKVISDLALDKLQADVAEFELSIALSSQEPAVHEQRIKSLFTLVQRYESLKGKATIPELENKLYKSFADTLLLNGASKATIDPSSTHLSTIFTLVKNNEELVRPIAQAQACNIVVPMDKIIKAYNDDLNMIRKSPEQAKELFANAVHLTLTQGASCCLSFLALQRDFPSDVSQYVGAMKEGAVRLAEILKPGITFEHAQQNRENLRDYLQVDKSAADFDAFISQQARDAGIENKYKDAIDVLVVLEEIVKNHPQDGKLRDFCREKRAALEQSRSENDYLALVDTKKNLQLIHSSVTSPEVAAVTFAINKLELRSKDLIGIGNKDKANKIKDALYNVDLLDRAHVFSNPTDLESCKKVKEELSAHRIFANPFKNDKRANSVIEVAAEIANYKERLMQVTGRKDEEPEQAAQAGPST